MALGKRFTKVSVVMIAGAVAGACGGGEDDTAALPPADSAAMAAPVVPPPPITDTSTVAVAPGATAAPGATPGATPPAATPAAPGAAPAPAPAAPPVAASAGGSGNVTEGQQLYATGVCMACHGPAGAGTALAPALNDNQWLWFTSRPTQEQLVTLIKTGIATPKQHPAPMPANGGASYTDGQLRSISAYILSISG